MARHSKGKFVKGPYELIHTIDGRNLKQPPFGCIPNLVNNGISTTNLNFSARILPSTVGTVPSTVLFTYCTPQILIWKPENDGNPKCRNLL